ncbi:MAG: hypothetical protein DI536_36270 [Archangium gephyra]|uniref:Uncharacterized protein n=1 Tax=Archangium gephyra TaxID=48 RepID=A0A2W5U3B2_9BACT|nr:MAG: hypothetical protein DI536_36270 [Archangium gephyra]
MVQDDVDLRANYHHLIGGTGGEKLYLPITANVIGLALEYRNIANNFLSDQIETGPNAWGREETYSKKPMRLSPLPAVNLMLVADKVQNRKDFKRYHEGTHGRSRELAYYFDLWLTVLNISPERYEELIEGL